MLKQGKIQLDRREIESIYKKQLSNRLQQEQRERWNDEQPFELVKSQVFPRELTPFCVDEYSKQSSLKLYPINKATYDCQLLGERIRLLYHEMNSFKQSKQRQKLAIMLNLEELNDLVEEINSSEQSQQQKHFVSYFEEGQVLQKVDVWRFKHSDESSSIPYKQRMRIFNDYQLILKLLEKLSKHKQFQHVFISTHSLLLLQYSSAQISEYQIKLRCDYVFQLLLGYHQSSPKQFDLIDNARKILLKILGISLQKSARSQLDQHHYEQIQYLISAHDMIKLNYQGFYKVKTQNTQKQPESSSYQQQVQKLKQKILSLEEIAKTELKEYKLLNPQPKLTQATKQSNKLFWSSIQKYILSNVTESERSAILNPVEKKQPIETVKRPQRKLPATNVKKQTKPEPKQISKIQHKPQEKDTRNKNTQPKQLILQAKFIASASDLKFRPQHLIQCIQTKQSILYILKTRRKQSQQPRHIACFINAKPQKQNFKLFGCYSSDVSKKSFIYSQKTDRFYPLRDKLCAVGYGPEVFLSIGKLDLIVPCFGCQTIDGKEMLKCVSYFPVSYSGRGFEMSGMEKVEDGEQRDIEKSKENELGIQREFQLEDIDIYEIRLAGQ